MAKNKGDKTNQNNRDNSMLMGIGIGAILLVLAEIFCIMAEIYYMLSGTTHIVVILISALLLLGTTGVFIYILKNALTEKLDEQKQVYEEMLQISKATYMKTKKISTQVSGEPVDITETINGIAAEIREDMASILQKQMEEINKRQMSIANAQVKRNREDMSVVLNSNKQMAEAINRKLESISGSGTNSEAIEDVQKSIRELYELCEKIASEPMGVNIEPLPKEVLENVTEPEIETMIEEINPEPIVEEAAPEPIVEPAEPEPQTSGDANRQLTPEEIAALFNNV